MTLVRMQTTGDADFVAIAGEGWSLDNLGTLFFLRETCPTTFIDNHIGVNVQPTSGDF